MKLKSIGSAITDRLPACRCVFADGDQGVSAALLGSGQPEAAHAVRMYVGPVPENAPGTDRGSCCLCLAEHAPKAANLILAPDTVMLEAAFNLIQMHLAKAQELAALAHQAADRRIDLQGLADRATEILENPLLIADPGHRIIAISDLDLDDFAWKHFKQLGQIPYHPDMIREENRFMAGLCQGRRIALVDGRHKKGYFIRCAVMSGDVYLAQIHVFSQFHEFTDMDMELTELLAGAAAMAIMGVQSGAAGTTSDYLISDLIMGKLTDPGAIQTRMDFAGWSLDRYKYLLVVRWEGDDKRMTLRDACMENLCRIFADGRSAADGIYMIVLFSTAEELTVGSPALVQVQRQLSRSGQWGVLSLPFEDLADTAYRYRQARDVLGLEVRADKKGRFIMAEACTVDLLIAQAGMKYRLIDYCHPLVRSLLAWDARTGKDYTETLRAYITSGRSFTKAAELLHMHRNSVIYRMDQIEEHLGYDFSRDEFTFALELSFRILDHMRRDSGEQNR